MAPTFPLFPSSPASAMQGVRPIDKEKEKGVNVQVLVRCRPLNEDELRSNALQVLSCNDQRREVSVNLNNAFKQIDRAFTFDKVFGPQAQQKELYEQAVSPIVNEVLEGFNCTIFAYGQTGTGKTYTMEGSSGKKACIINGGMSSDAGIIPRAIQQIVDTLESQNSEYSMKVTFLELYNEEIMDLLAPASEEAAPRPADDRQRKPLTLMEDGKGGVLVRGLEEEIVYSAKEIYNLLERGSAKRRTAETLLNKQSSRSHSVFSVTIHVKEATPEGEELIKCGKLNLVDLAGSENISRSGARDSRAREAGEINKSLLTLGRVITSLVEHLGHIPYRDSKLTRLLRDSLGGKTKTCIIATVSPSVHCLEETLSTLDYAHRAKNIKNKPEVNQKMMKSTLIKDLYGEIEKLKAEVHAAWEKNGVYLPRERYLQEEAERKAMSQRIEHMELEFGAKGKQVDNLQEALDMERQQCADLAIKLENNQRKLDQTLEALADGKERLKQAQYTIKERDFIIAKFQHSEIALFEQAGSLQSNLESSVNDIAGLYIKIDRKNKLETDNLNLVRMFHGELGQQLTVLRDFVACSVEQQQQQFHNMEEYIRAFMVTKDQATDTVKGRVLNMKDMFSSGLKHIHDLVHSHEKDSTSTFQNLNVTISAHASALEELLSTSVLEAEEVFQDLRKTLSMHQAAISSFVCQQQEVAQKSMNATREVSVQVEKFFQLLERYTAEISRGVIDSQQGLLENLTELEDTYEEKSKQEERLLIEKIAEIVAAATARKSEIVNSKIKAMRESSNEHSRNFQQSMVNIQEAASQSQSQWQAYMEKAQGDFCEASASLITEHKCLEGIERNCEISVAKAREGWKRTQDLVQHFETNNLLAVDLIVKEEIYGNGLWLSNLKELNDSAQSDFHAGYDAAMESIDRSVLVLQGCMDADKDATTMMLSTMATQRHTLEELQSFHTSGTGDIDIRSDHCFNREYSEDKPTCTTPRKRLIEVPTKATIEALCAPSIESLTQEFKEGSDKGQQYQGTMPVMMESKIPNFVEPSLLLIKDNRVHLTMVN